MNAFLLSFKRLLNRIWRRQEHTYSAVVPIEVENQIHDIAIQQQHTPEVLLQHFLATGMRTQDIKWQLWRSLTPREQVVAALGCLGYTNRQIAHRLMISKNTVKTHIRNILRKFDLHSKDELRFYLAEWDFSAFK